MLGGVLGTVVGIHARIRYMLSASAGSGAYPSQVADESVFAHMMAVGGDISDFNNSTDSLEAIRNRLDAGFDESAAAANDTANTLLKQVIGNKADDPAADAGTTRSLMNYVKWLVQEAGYRAVPRAGHARAVHDSGWYDVVNISDRGFLTGIHQRSADTATVGLGGIRVTVDGTLILSMNADDANAFSMGTAPGSLAFNHRFDTSLRVQHYAASRDVITTVAYTND